MTEADIYGALTQILRDVFLRDDLVAEPDLNARTVEGWDSFKHIEIIMACERRFGVKITTRELDSIKNVSDLVAIIARKAA